MKPVNETTSYNRATIFNPYGHHVVIKTIECGEDVEYVSNALVEPRHMSKLHGHVLEDGKVVIHLKNERHLPQVVVSELLECLVVHYTAPMVDVKINTVSDVGHILTCRVDDKVVKVTGGHIAYGGGHPALILASGKNYYIDSTRYIVHNNATYAVELMKGDVVLSFLDGVTIENTGDVITYKSPVKTLTFSLTETLRTLGF